MFNHFWIHLIIRSVKYLKLLKASNLILIMNTYMNLDKFFMELLMAARNSQLHSHTCLRLVQHVGKLCLYYFLNIQCHKYGKVSNF